MKITIDENHDNFMIRTEAETIQEAALLVRMGINSTKELRYSTAYATNDSVFHTLVIGKAKNANCEVPHRR